jgi:hypothetical protein
LITAWVLFPALLVLLAAGCGLLLEAVARVRLQGALVVPAGMAVVIVAGQLTTSTDATAELTVPLICAIAVAGILISKRWRAERPDAWPVIAAIGVVAVYGLPVLLSGDPTFLGFIRLDDTATWLTLTDRVMEHGHSLAGLDPSTYEATLAFNLGDGYPVGVFIPLGIGTELTGVDPGWLIQPYMSVLAACLALCLWEIPKPLVPSRPLRAAVAFIAAQAALLVGYVQWGGIKEVAAAALIALSLAVAPRLLEERRPGRWAAVLAVAVAALLAVLTLGGAIWVVPGLIALAVVLWRRSGPRVTLARAGAVVGWVLVFSAPLLVPVLLDGRLLPPTSSPLTSATAKGNLIEPLGIDRLAGIWPAGDFRLDAVDGGLTTLLILFVIAAAGLGFWFAVRSRALALAIYGLGIPVACLVLVAIGSPWVEGKALATASPALLTLACAAGASLIVQGRRAIGSIALIVLAAGVLWSNALASRDANLAPYDQLHELVDIGHDVAGEGPSLMTEYLPFGARHALRESDAEGISELRRRVIPLNNGATVEKGGWSDTDPISTDALLTYRTLVLRRSPLQSRPPSAYDIVSSGDYYDVWQRPESGFPVAQRFPLGAGLDPTGEAPCGDLRALASAGGAGTIAFVERPATVPVPARDLAIPESWARGGNGTFVPNGDGTVSATVDLPDDGDWRVWIGGSIRGGMELVVDGEEVGSVRHLLNNSGLFTDLGEAKLGAGAHRLELVYTGADLLRPGSGGFAEALGPVVLTSDEAADGEVQTIAAADAADLCGKRLDWYEILP